MRKINYVVFLCLLWGIIVFLSGCGGGGGGAVQKVSKPFEYSGYSFPEYTGYTKTCQYIPLSDGTKLAASIFVPSGGPSSGPFPVILWITPGHRESVNLETKKITIANEESIKFFTSYGYVWVSVEMRGSGASFGSRYEREPKLGIDGKDVIDWIAKQSWCNGNVGMVGASYQGFVQFCTAAEKPKALKAIFPEIAEFDAYTGGLFYPGGIWNMAMTATAPQLIAMDDLNIYNPSANKFPSLPVTDEDGDGDLIDEIPIVDKTGSFLNVPPTYEDGKVRTNVYYNATKEHTKNVTLGPTILQAAPYRDSVLPGSPNLTYLDLGPNNRPVRIAETGVAIYNWGGWFDYHVKCTTHWFATLRKTNPSRLLITPAAHGIIGGPYSSYLGLTMTTQDYNKERLRFFDRYLKGIDNGIDREPPVYIYVMGKGWRAEEEWPLSRQIMTNFYFDSKNTLSLTRSTDGYDTYTCDFTHDSRSQDGHSRWTLLLNYTKNIIKRTSQDAKCLTYTSPPLTKDVEVTGHPIVHLWVSSTATDGDIFVYLEDVDENGEAIHVTDGLLRANFPYLIPNNDILSPGSNMSVFPDLPWHGFRQSDYVDEIFRDGKKVYLVLDLMPTSWVFKKGHRIRVSIACSDYPTFQLHPKLSPNNNPLDPSNVIPTITVFRSGVYHSYISLPIIYD